MKFPKPRKRNYYRYLCGVAEEMNITFRCEGSKDRAVVMNLDGKLQIVILRHIEKGYNWKEYKNEI